MANISANSVVNVNEQCSANQEIQINDVNVVTGDITCAGPIEIGSIKVLQNATCTNKQNITVISKIIADQIAKITAETRAGFMDASTTNANTFIDVQNNISTTMTARCNNSQRVTVGTQSYQIGNIKSDSYCNILVSAFSQNSACIQDILAQIENTNDIKQVTEATSTAGGDMGQLLSFVFMILLIVGIIFIGGPLISKMAGGGGLDFFKSGDDQAASLPELRGQLQQLKSQAEGMGLELPTKS